MIAEALQSLQVPLADLTPDPANLRKHSARNISTIAASLKRFGQDQVLVVQKDGMVIRKGNGRYEAARQLGWDTMAAIVIDEGDVKAIERAIADNRTAELAEWDDEALYRVLKAFDDPEAVEAVGFTDDDMRHLDELCTAPTEGDWAEAFEAVGDVTEVKDNEQVTFVLHKEDLQALRTHLQKYDTDKNKAIMLWLQAS